MESRKLENQVVKRAGHTEPFDEKKIYASIYASCLAVRVPQGEAELVAEQVISDVKKWLSDKHEVTAHDIRRVAASHFSAINADAAYLYQHHKVIN